MSDRLDIDVRVRFPGEFRVQARCAVSLAPGAMTVVFGPSGSGKTTLLRAIARLAKFEGSLTISGKPLQEPVGLVFQNYGLFPHMTAAANIAYGLSRLSRAARSQRVRELLEVCEISHLARRYPHQVSGGEAQRIALARAVAPGMRLVLMDEPLAALDEVTRRELRSSLKNTLARLGIAAMIVTHDVDDAFALGERMIAVHQGAVVQEGLVREVFSRPASARAATALGWENIINGDIVGKAGGDEDEGARIGVCIGALPASAPLLTTTPPANLPSCPLLEPNQRGEARILAGAWWGTHMWRTGNPAAIIVRARDVEVMTDGDRGVPGIIEHAEPALAGQRLTIAVPTAAAPFHLVALHTGDCKVGERVRVSLPRMCGAVPLDG